MTAMGRRRWAIAEGYLPEWSEATGRKLESHETACILNTSPQDAHVELTVFYSDRAPAGPYRLTIPAQRTRHVRFNDLRDPEPIPLGVDFSTVLESDVPVVVQHTRLDSRQTAGALLSTIAFSEA